MIALARCKATCNICGVTKFQIDGTRERAEHVVTTAKERHVAEEHPDLHEFTEDVDDASMCVCGIPTLTHDQVYPPASPDDDQCGLCGSFDPAHACPANPFPCATSPGQADS